MRKTQNEYNKKWREKNPAKVCVQHRRYRDTHRAELRKREHTRSIKLLSKKIDDETELTRAKLKLLRRYEKLYRALHGVQDDRMVYIMREIDMSLKK